MQAELLDDVGQARVTAVETKAQRAQRVRVAALCVQCASLLLELALDFDPDHPALPRPAPHDPCAADPVAL